MTRGGDRTAEAARFGIVGKGRCGLYKWLQSGGGQWMIKCGEAMREMPGRAHIRWNEAERKGGKAEGDKSEGYRREGEVESHGSEGDGRECNGSRETWERAK